MTTIPGHYADEPVAYEPDHNHGCGHCDVRGVTLYDCPHCGEFACSECRERPCTEPVACQCGETREGREIAWDDGEPTCDRCPTTECDVCEITVREPVGRMWRKGWLLCRECRERADARDAA